MKIVADEKIPEVAAAFAELGNVSLLPGREINPINLQDCQCLIVRTVTPVDENLLRNSAVEFVATATIGTDHVNLDYLTQSGIGFSNAAGCNAESAAEYVVSGLFALSRRYGFDPFNRRVGIVGLGNVGGALYRILTTLGIECLCCDPPLMESGDTSRSYIDLDRLITECDIISLHVPLTREDDHATYHLLDRVRLQSLQPGCLLINAARGEVIDNQALLRCMARQDLHVFLDTWENEPTVLTELLASVDLATPHIAGYSFEGRLRGTQMALEAACLHFGLESNWHMSKQLPDAQILNINRSRSRLEFWQDLFAAHFDIWRDHRNFTAGVAFDQTRLANYFDSLRRVFTDRLEYPRWRIDLAAVSGFSEPLRQLGFNLFDNRSA